MKIRNFCSFKWFKIKCFFRPFATSQIPSTFPREWTCRRSVGPRSGRSSRVRAWKWAATWRGETFTAWYMRTCLSTIRLCCRRGPRGRSRISRRRAPTPWTMSSWRRSLTGRSKSSRSFRFGRCVKCGRWWKSWRPITRCWPDSVCSTHSSPVCRCVVCFFLIPRNNSIFCWKNIVRFLSFVYL